MIKVSVVILNWNGADMLRRFLPSVISCSQGKGIEVCVADNGSSDDSCRIVEEEFPSVRLIRLPENYGFADGYNKALEQVDAEYVVLLNSDVEVSSDWLSAIWICIRRLQPASLKFSTGKIKNILNMQGRLVDLSTDMGIRSVAAVCLIR